MANRIPVVRHLVEGLLVLRCKRRFKSLLDDGIANGLALTVAPLVINPVIGNGHAQGHFGHIEVMRRIPVAEAASGKHLLLEMTQHLLLARGAINITQYKNPAQVFSRDREQAAASEFTGLRLKLDDGIGLALKHRLHLPPVPVGLDVVEQCLFLALEQQQTRM